MFWPWSLLRETIRDAECILGGARVYDDLSHFIWRLHVAVRRRI